MTTPRAGGTFPLPEVASPLPTKSRSRRLRQRVNRANLSTHLANRCIAALNWLNCPTSTYPSPSSVSSISVSRTKLSLVSYIYSSCVRYVRRLGTTSSDDSLQSNILPSYIQNPQVVPINAEKIALP